MDFIVGPRRVMSCWFSAFFEFFLEEFQSVLLDNEVGVKYIFFGRVFSSVLCWKVGRSVAEKHAEKTGLC